MRAKDFLLIEAQNLFEVNMSPSNLKKLAGQIPAKVGIEFEMIVPDVGSVDSDYDDAYPEEDMDYDERVDDIEDICRFFDDREYNVRSEISSMRDELNDRYQDWLNEKVREEWDTSEGRAFFAKWCRENVSEEDVADQVDTPEDLLGDRIPSKEDWEKFIEEEWEAQDSNYDNAFDEFRDEKMDDGDFDENAFLQDIGMEYMSDVPRRINNADISWPHMRYPESGGDAEYNLQQVADDFSEAVGMPANFSTSYHGGYRQDDAYDIEPDSSLSGRGDDAGLEFITPPLSLDDAIEQIKLVKKWADGRGAYTNSSTGLHMNISVPDFDQDKLDFVKLTLLLGDKYLLDRFGRSANTYCRSAMDVIAEAPSAEDKELLFKKLKNNLETIASKVIHSGRVGKFTSINPKDNRVEFRGPGGDWLDQNFDKVEDTLYRCVVALDAAVDPEKYKKDYLKKLTKMFAPTKGSLEDVFVQYAAGNITRSELKFKLKTAQAERSRQKLTDQGIVELPYFNHSTQGDWIVEYENPSTFDIKRLILKRTNQVNTDRKALEAAMKAEPEWFKPDEIENITVTENTGRHDYVILDKDNNAITEEYAYTPLQALEFAYANRPGLQQERDSLTIRMSDEPEDEPQTYQTSSGTTARLAPGEQLYIVRNNDTGDEVTLAAVNGANAIGRATRNNPTRFPGGNTNSSITVELANTSAPSPAQGYNLYRVRGNGVSQYIAARSTNEAGRIAITVYPEMGNSVDGLTDIAILDQATPDVVASYLSDQNERLQQMNQPSQSTDWRDRLRGHLSAANAQPAFGNGVTAGQPGAGQLYDVNDAGAGAGGVRIRATSPDEAIERARLIYSLAPDRELEATPAN